ncbi:MAG: tyrosine-protein phosphatase [Paracoccus hibiscisoli]|uniref:tyrosine-protein phosphatase n=1 Tax=Paracoccus hibiscisoli TaxID=2023261 RepID=UPI00391B5FEC
MRRLRMIALAMPVAAGMAASSWAGWLHHSGNLHAVLAGQVYRSAQPSAAQLVYWTDRHGFRSVLNLRGASDADWYRIERAAANRLHLRHADFAMRDSEVLTPERAAALIALLDRLPKPVLIHCKAGADRTGLAAALYLASEGHGEALAEAQISFRYGHVSLPISAAWPLDQSWEAMEPAFGYDS